MKIRLLIFLIASFTLHATGYGQNGISYDYISSSNLKDDDGNKYGKGDISIIAGRLNMPLSFKMNDKRQPTIWAATLSVKYGITGNSGEAKQLNPNEIINTSLNISHIRPINERWSMIASAGTGIYAMPDNIRWKSILANGGVFFVYRFNKNFSLGGGGGLTNSYGIPIVLPMVYVSWKKSGKYEMNLDFTGRLKVSGATWLSPKFKLELTAIEMDGMSAVIDVNGGTRIYSSTMFKSHITSFYQINKNFSVYMGIGADWRRTANIRSRRLKDMFNFNHSGDRHFSTAMRLSAGVRYQLK